jgi:mRNA interferase MazF
LVALKRCSQCTTPRRNRPVPRAKRGEIWMADLGLAAKVRPVLVLSVDYRDEERAVVTYVIRITSLRATRYEVRHETRRMPAGAFDAQGLGSLPDIKLHRCLGLVDSDTNRPPFRRIIRRLILTPSAAPSRGCPTFSTLAMRAAANSVCGNPAHGIIPASAFHCLPVIA